ncbi:helix-turn-helix domain-containing protein [Streptomyces sp. NBC_01622]|uniref:helix-turn-helix domain-containing protein n=1 Tax=Streptomyces sp. NBC_01622 TaxID=2975903 RepID=UPI00386C9E13|nr:helix-turn-helix domain-containing protein [Streptomyces sp. NBC_01622]WTE48670.1 helix-turn-helix domain-containing protein [Streptomyces sp. NBC_01622]
MKPQFEEIDALLAAARKEAELPPAEQRRMLREALHLSRAQVARALGVSPSTVGGWESGRDPGGEVRDQYAYFLKGAQTKLAALDADGAAEDAVADTGTGAEEAPDAGPGDAAHQTPAVREADDVEDVEILTVPRPCVLCGHDARHEVAGYPQHLDPAECTVPAPPTTAPSVSAPAAAPAGRVPRPAPPRRSGSVKTVGSSAGRVRTAADVPDPIGDAVAAALAEHRGDVEAATAALVKRAIPDAMALLDSTRKGGRYDIVAHPGIPDVLRKQTARGADQIWEARPKWTRPELPAGQHEVARLDINGAYLSALKTHLPIGRLEHSGGNVHDRRRSGVHRITASVWEHDAVLPNPLGDRDEPGPLWVTEPTLRLLLRLAGPKYRLCEPPVIHESFTSGATESLLEKFRITLKDARDKAIAEDDEVTGEYVKAMYSKFVSTMGESTYNRELNRPDWMHLIRSQAFANLWTKAFKAHDEGLMVVSVQGTDELHVIGDWHQVFTEGRGVTEVKVKDTYIVGGPPEDPAAPGDTDQ